MSQGLKKGLQFHFGLSLLLGIWGHALLISGLIGCFSRPWVFSLSLVFILACISWGLKYWHFCGSPKSVWASFSPIEKTMVTLCGLIFAIALVQGLLPAVSRDALIHHLALPLLYLEQGKIYEIDFAEQAYNPMLVDMLFAWTLAFKNGDFLSHWVHLGFALLTAHLIFIFLKAHLGLRAGLLAALIFLSLPQVVQSSTQAYVDLGVTYFATLSLIFVYDWTSKFENKKILFFSGVLAGLAMACKYNGALIILCQIVLLLFFAIRKQWKVKQIIGLYGIFFLGILVGDFPWLFKNILWTGNPLYPFFKTIIGWQPLVQESITRVPALIHRHLIYGEPVWKILALPLRIFFFGKEGDPRLFDGRLSPLLIVFIPWAFSVPKGRLKSLAHAGLGIVLLYMAYLFVFRIVRMRYLLPIVPIMILLTLIGFESQNKGAWKRSASILVGIFLTLNFFWSLKRLSNLDLGLFLRGKISRQAYLTKHLKEYPVQQFANQHLSPNHKILFVFLGHRGYYCDIPYTYDFHDPGRSWRRWLRTASTSDQLLSLMKAEGITHLMIYRKYFEMGLGPENLFLLSQERRRVLQAFIKGHAQTLYEDQGVQLLKI